MIHGVDRARAALSAFGVARPTRVRRSDADAFND
jgi:hypothetical protein